MSLDLSGLFNGRDLKESNEKIKKEKILKEVDEVYISKSDEILEPEKHSLHFRKEKRRGKVVTMVGLFQLEDQKSKELLKSLKKSLGTGGTLRGDYLEFQGEISEKLKIELLKRGFKFKK
jgi:translation initiation factor 1